MKFPKRSSPAKPVVFQTPYQSTTTTSIDRKDHVWIPKYVGESLVGYKCCSCGATVTEVPPNYPTPENWYPLRYEVLTEEEREIYRGTK